MLQTTFDKDSLVFSGRKGASIYNPQASIGSLLFTNYLSEDDNYSMVRGWIRVLQSQVNSGDVVNSIVPTISPDDKTLVDFYVAAILNGNPIHFIDHRAGAVEIQTAVQVTNAKKIIIPEKEEEEKEEWNSSSLFLGSKNPTPVAFFTTAGISGLPKLVPLSAESLIHHLSNPLHSASPALSFLPLSKYRIFLDTFVKLVRGSSMKINTQFSLDIFLEECCNGFEELHLTNYQLAKLASGIQSPIDHIKQIHCSGCYANPMLIRRAKSVFPNAKIVYSYGLTEFGGPVAINPDAGRKYTVGQLNDNYEVSIRDEKGGALGYGCQGEIFVKAAVPFEGYFLNNEDSVQALTLDGWTRTGDIGYFDEVLDLHILDRDKEVIVYDCNVISPTELEFYLRKLPGVEDAKVFAVPDEEKGELPAARIVPKKGVELTKEGVEEFIVSQLGYLKALRGGVSFVQRL